MGIQRWSIVISILFVVSVLTACGSGGGGDAEPAPEPAPRFDLVRVAPDGSAVIAATAPGKVAAGASPATERRAAQGERPGAETRSGDGAQAPAVGP